MIECEIPLVLCQINPTVGDLKNNIFKIKEIINESRSPAPNLFVFPESAITGYPIEDLALRAEFVTTVEHETDMLVEWLNTKYPQHGFLFGTLSRGNVPGPDGQIAYNTVLYVYQNERTEIIKADLPNYGPFDEKRIFLARTPFAQKRRKSINFEGFNLGVVICEELWQNTAEQMFENHKKIDAYISLNASPYSYGKTDIRVQKAIKFANKPFAYVNMVGGQDELVFDGRSFIIDEENGTRFLQPYVEQTFYQTLYINRKVFGQYRYQLNDTPYSSYHNENVFDALVLGTRDYFHKQGFKKAVLGLSGGLDSALVAVIAAKALGAENLLCVRLPSAFSSQHSLDDADAIATNLGVELRTIQIHEIVDQTIKSVETYGNMKLSGVALENIQSRIRGQIFMSIANQEGRLVLNTGNKSELSTGYFTIGGDNLGGFNPLKDVYKTAAYKICEYVNSYIIRDCIPQSILDKKPSAELGYNQYDTDSLPDYPILDPILERLLDRNLGLEDTAFELGADLDLVKRVWAMILRNEYKRRMSPMGIQISYMLYGKDRRYPNVLRGY